MRGSRQKEDMKERGKKSEAGRKVKGVLRVDEEGGVYLCASSRTVG